MSRAAAANHFPALGDMDIGLDPADVPACTDTIELTADESVCFILTSIPALLRIVTETDVFKSLSMVLRAGGFPMLIWWIAIQLHGPSTWARCWKLSVLVDGTCCLHSNAVHVDGELHWQKVIAA